MMNSWGLLLITVAGGLVFVVSGTCPELYHINGPQIFPCKKEIILQQGLNYTIQCRSNSKIKFIQQEVLEEKIGDFLNITSFEEFEDADYKYEITLDLINVDRYAIGYYACIDDSVKKDVINSLVAEPNNTEHTSYIYIYVNGTDSVFAPMMEVVTSKSDSYVVACRPSTPDVEVKLYQADIPEPYKLYSSKIGFVFDKESVDIHLTEPITMVTCGFKNRHRTVDKDQFFFKRQEEQPEPRIFKDGPNKFLPNETFSLNCTVNYTSNIATDIIWKYPKDSLNGTIIPFSNNHRAKEDGILFRSITILNATKDHEGEYTCILTSNCGGKNVSYTMKYLSEPKLNIKPLNPSRKIEPESKTAGFNVEIDAYPPATFKFYKNGILLENNVTYTQNWLSYSKEARLLINSRTVDESGNYTIEVTNGYLNKTEQMEIKFKKIPTVNFTSTDKTCVRYSQSNVQCEAVGYPLPNVTWIFSHNGTITEMKSSTIEQKSLYKVIATLKILCNITANIMCKATNVIRKKNRITQSLSRSVFVYEIEGGFGIWDLSPDQKKYNTERENVTTKCLASKYDFKEVRWFKDNKAISSDIVLTEYSDNDFSLVAKLIMPNAVLGNSGNYTCRGYKHDGTETNQDININIEALEAPSINLAHNIIGGVEKHQKVEMICTAQGIPRPTITWYKDNDFFSLENENVHITFKNVNRSTVVSNITIEHMYEENRGNYECQAESKEGLVREAEELIIKEKAITKYLILIGVIIACCAVLVVYLLYRVRKEKRLRKELAAAGLLYFKEGATKSINPDLAIDEQAELLPYDERFEFPPDKLTLDTVLGTGAFGVVYKAFARGLNDAEQSTPVAVKMVKKNADNMYIKALASELKIMVHLGKHINIVNLLGACTKNVGRRELWVIVEYCKFGNIHNYMQKHREVFIDQFSEDNKEYNFGKVNRGYDSSGSTALQSDYSTANTQETCLTNNSNRTSRKHTPNQPKEDNKASEGYVQPEWCSSYVSDYSDGGRNPRPLTSRDLLAWAFQVARGMEYLAGRKILHGDLAARNILLAEDNVVKICDFGLARSIYNNEEYKKSENSLLPVKWLAVECMEDRMFSTQSDVWAFGIVLWELFSLARTPYPNMSPMDLLHFLKDGNRLQKPAYSDDRLYALMRHCWSQKPSSRPSFTNLQQTLGSFLADNVRNYYVDLNTKYADENNKKNPEEQDYLAMMSGPDYNNLVTPSPHYVNEVGGKNFFPNSPAKVDEEGYLQMSPSRVFSPKPVNNTKFDFDPRKMNARGSEASAGGTELTPMLALGTPRSGSDSDPDCTSPNTKISPIIEEDEVFEKNMRNLQHVHSAVTNPTYITLPMNDAQDDVKKPPLDLETNTYVNMKPNGLVK